MRNNNAQTRQRVMEGIFNNKIIQKQKNRCKRLLSFLFHSIFKRKKINNFHVRVHKCQLPAVNNLEFECIRSERSGHGGIKKYRYTQGCSHHAICSSRTRNAHSNVLIGQLREGNICLYQSPVNPFVGPGLCQRRPPPQHYFNMYVRY